MGLAHGFVHCPTLLASWRLCHEQGLAAPDAGTDAKPSRPRLGALGDVDAFECLVCDLDADRLVGVLGDELSQRGEVVV
jgi:hypothetical protein